jgi:hypothetical protein
MLNLIELIQLAGVKLGRYKIHLAKHSKDDPINYFYAGTFKEWQEFQTQKNFECDHVIGLVSIQKGQWLFTGVWTIQGSPKKIKDGWKYKTDEVKGLEHLAGRVIVSFVRTFRQSYLLGDSYGSKLQVHEIRPERLSIADFPGYSSVNITFDTLSVLCKQRPPAWLTALRSVGGVYLIADTSNGMLYVGSAYGDGGIWTRWETYANNGHGGNKDLIDLLTKMGNNHASNFLFSILEICDLLSSKDEVLARECHWKRVLLSREFGYNKN